MVFRCKGGKIASCPHQMPPDLNLWANHFRREAITTAINSAKHHSYSNSFGLLRLALSQLKAIDFAIVRDDKDNGFCFVHKSELNILAMNALPEKFYTKVAASTVNPRSLLSQLESIARRIATLQECPRLRGSITRHFSGSMSTKLGYTVKTHKAQGKISVRTLHLSRSPALHGLSSWLVHELSPELGKLSWLARDAQDFKDKLASITMPDSAIMACIDIKDFYLSGNAPDLATDMKSYFSGELAETVSEVTITLLGNQYITTPGLPDLYRCTSGSGMGLKHSGHVASLSYAARVEVPFFSARPYRRGLLFYARFHDDVFMLFDCRTSLRTLLPEYKHRSSFFVIEVRQISQVKVQYLELTVAIQAGRFFIEPTLEKVPVPLCESSCHPFSVHKSWPSAVVARTAGLSDRPEFSINKLRINYAMANTCSSTLSRMQSKHMPTKQRDSNVLQVACVLRYHPVFAAAVKRALIRAPLPPSVDMEVLVAWKNALPSVASHIAKHNRVLDTSDDNVTGMGIRLGSSLLLQF